MKCQEVQQLIHDYLDQLMLGQAILGSAKFKSLAHHFELCNECAEKLQQEQQFRLLLKNLNKDAPVPASSAGFVDRALRTAALQNNTVHHASHRQGFIKGFGSALVAGLALWVVAVLLPPLNKDSSPDLPAVGGNVLTVSLQESTDIKLAFHSLKEVQNATIRISLSDNIELEGYQNQQTLEWKTNLVAGDNVLILPIKALKPHQGKIIAQISHNNLHKSIELTLDIKNDADTYKPKVSDNYKITTPVA